jgi:peptidoglycan/LPS O-acetylase OafA/YrhL
MLYKGRKMFNLLSDQNGWRQQLPGGYEPDLGGRIPALDAVRGLAILMVTVFRFNTDPSHFSYPWSAVFTFCRYGNRGVDLFFVLSGFLITGILYDAKAGPRFFRTFYGRRTLRIFPLYYGVLLLVLVVLPRFSPGVESLYRESITHQAWLWLYGSNILIAWNGDWMLTGFNHFWSLAVEEHFYLMWPLVIYFTTRRQAMLVSAVCIVGAAVLRIVLLQRGVNYIALDTLTPCRLDSLAVGSFLALAARSPAGMRSLVPQVCAVAFAAVLALVAIRWYAGHAFTLTFTVVALLCGALIVASVTTDPRSWLGRLAQARSLQFCGKYSYGWYVYQGTLEPALNSWFTPYDLGAWLGSDFVGCLLYIGWGALISLGMAMLSWHFYESHFLGLKELFVPKEEKRGFAIPESTAG